MELMQGYQDAAWRSGYRLDSSLGHMHVDQHLGKSDPKSYTKVFQELQAQM